MTLPCVVNATNSELDTHVQIAQAQARRLGAGTVRVGYYTRPLLALLGDLGGPLGRFWALLGWGPAGV